MLYTGIILSFDIRCCLQAYVLLQSKKKTGTSLLILAECERGVFIVCFIRVILSVYISVYIRC